MCVDGYKEQRHEEDGYEGNTNTVEMEDALMTRMLMIVMSMAGVQREMGVT